MALQLPRFSNRIALVDFSLVPSYAFHVWWDTIAKKVEENVDSLAVQVQALTDLNSDDLLTPAKKAIWIFIHSFLTGEQAGLDTQATALGVTTEKTTYDTAVSALTTYLATLTTPVAWNNLTGNTTIVGTTFRTKFNDVMTSKQALVNKLANEASKQSIVLNPINDVVILADAAGTIKSGQLTKTVNLTASSGTADITTSGIWSRTVTSGVTCTIGASTGVLSITAFSAAEQVTVPISFTYSGVTRTGSVHIIKSLDTAEANTTANTANTQANTATTNAATADAKAVAASREAARLASYTSPTIVLSASDAGTTATISIAAHTRVYPVQGTYDVPDVAISAGSITGKAYSTKYWVYYDDTTLAATTPTFIATTTQLTAQVGSANGRHLVGVVTTPASGGSATTGSGGLPPAGGGGDGTALP